MVPECKLPPLAHHCVTTTLPHYSAPCPPDARCLSKEHPPVSQCSSSPPKCWGHIVHYRTLHSNWTTHCRTQEEHGLRSLMVPECKLPPLTHQWVTIILPHYSAPCPPDVRCPSKKHSPMAQCTLGIGKSLEELTERESGKEPRQIVFSCCSWYYPNSPLLLNFTIRTVTIY